MEPRIQYATGKDGATIAYWTMGEGVPLVIPPPAMPFSHIEQEWQIPEWRHWYEHLARQCRIIRYDGRGAGLSDRDAPAVGLDGEIADLEAIVDHLGLQTFALFGIFYTGPLVIAYAVKHPQRVSHLVLWCSFSNCEDGRRPDTSEAFDRLMDLNWELFTETMAHTLFGWSEGDPAHRFAEYMRAGADHRTVKAHWEANRYIDVTPLTGQVGCPTLVLHRRHLGMVPLSVARQLAADIPGAQLRVVDGASLSPYVGDIEEPLRLIGEFIGGDVDALRRAAHGHVRAAGGFRTIMFTDMEGSTLATQRMGDAQALLRAHNEIVRDALHTYAGSEVKHTGDGIMASFDAASAAVECAIAIQRAVDGYSRDHVGDNPLRVRIGINAGEPVVEGGDLFGTAVQLASRICSRAEPQQVLVSDVVRQLVAGKGFLFADRGETDLRGFEEPVRLFEVRWRDDA